MTEFGPNAFPSNRGAGRHRILILLEVETWGADSWDAVNRTGQNIGIGPGTYAEHAMPTHFKPGRNHTDHTLHSTTLRDFRVLSYTGFFPEVVTPPVHTGKDQT